MCDKVIRDVQLVCRRVKGMHVRPWNILCGVAVICAREGSTIKARGDTTSIRSICGLVSLNVAYGDTVDLHVETGTEESAAAIIAAAEEALSDSTLWKQCPWQSEEDR